MLCPLCGSSDAVEIFKLFRPEPANPTAKHTEDLFGRTGAIARCTTCHLVRQEDALDAPYREAVNEDYLSEERGIRHTFVATLDRVAQHRPPPGRLLDVGCGPGLLLDEARARGWDVMGVEPSRWAAEIARQRGIDVHEGGLDSLNTDTRFDVVVANDVIEHVTGPVAFAQRLADALTSGGVTFIATPNVESVMARLLRRWWWSIIPNHRWFFAPRTLEAVLAKAGLEVVGVTTHPKSFSLGYYAARLGGYHPLAGRASVRIASLFGRDRLVTPDLRDRMAMIARKP
ncbi:MAG: class I SAM-dependent methyltransferase [Actinomycetota bacterium]